LSDEELPPYMLLGRFTKVPRQEYLEEDVPPETGVVGADERMFMLRLTPEDFDTVWNQVERLTGGERSVFDLEEGELSPTDRGTWKVKCPKCGNASYFDNWRDDGCDFCGFNPVKIKLQFEGEDSDKCPECGTYRRMEHGEECSENGYHDEEVELE